MSDDISIPRATLSGNAPGRTSFTHSYRSRRTGMDGNTKTLLLAASALGAVLVGGMAVWSFRGHHQVEGVPTIEADSRPMRVKPDNPGGMTAIGVNDPSAPSGGAGDLAPAAEQPDPQALLAQRRAAAAPKIAPPPPATPPAPAPAVQPLAAPMLATPVAVPGSDLAPRPTTGGPLVQLAALDSEPGAAAEWQRLARKLPDLFNDHRPVVQRTEQSGKAFWRLRTGGFADIADATEFCKRVRAKGVACSLANF